MKKMITMITAAVLLSASVFAHDGSNVNTRVKSAFQKDFAEATNVKWESKDDFYFAEFKVGNSSFSAAYNEEGERVATSRSVKLDMLPIAVLQALNSKYEGYKFAKYVTEVNFQNETNYYITIANDKKVLNLKAGANGDLTVESKRKR